MQNKEQVTVVTIRSDPLSKSANVCPLPSSKRRISRLNGQQKRAASYGYRPLIQRDKNLKFTSSIPFSSSAQGWRSLSCRSARRWRVLTRRTLHRADQETAPHQLSWRRVSRVICPLNIKRGLSLEKNSDLGSDQKHAECNYFISIIFFVDA